MQTVRLTRGSLLRPLALLCGIAIPAVLSGQEVTGPPGPRILLPAEREIALARSAAPPSVSVSATVWVLDGEAFRVAHTGTTGVACYVARTWPLSLEPHCFDEEGARTIMMMGMRRTELLHRGVSVDSVEREIAAGLASGRFPLPRRPAMSWMLSGEQVLYNDQGRRVGAWRPHIMLYFPYLTAEALGTGSNQDLDAGIVVHPGTPGANLMIVVPQAVRSDTVGGGARAP